MACLLCITEVNFEKLYKKEGHNQRRNQGDRYDGTEVPRVPVPLICPWFVIPLVVRRDFLGFYNPIQLLKTLKFAGP